MLKENKTLLFPLAACLAFTVLEGTLTLLVMAVPKAALLLHPPASEVPDVRLGHRPNPAYPGHDSRGWRNPSASTQARIAVLGDSQTYGVGVDSAEAWPRRLEALSNASVYALAYGGYGPVHSLLLWEEAASVKPELVIEAVYAGNDLFDAFDLVYNKGAQPGLKSPDADVRQAVALAEETAPIAARVRRMFNFGSVSGADGSGPLRSLAAHSQSLALVRALRKAFSPAAPAGVDAEWTRAKAFAKAHASFCRVFEHAGARTVFTSQYRLAALDLDDVRIAEGHRICLRALKRMAALAASGGMGYLVVLIPTKELAFRAAFEDPPADFARLVQNEELMWRRTKEFLDRNAIKYVDTLPALRERIKAGAEPYPVSFDGHPDRTGHEAIAQAVFKHLRTSGQP